MRLSLNMSCVFSNQYTMGECRYSILSKLGEIISIAESRFGDGYYTDHILGIEFTSNKTPCVWTRSFKGRYGVILQITEDCFDDMYLAVFQTSYLTIRCLSYVNNELTTYFEEGLACYYAIEVLNEMGVEYRLRDTKQQLAYEIAKNVMLSIGDEGLRKIRKKVPEIWKISPRQLIYYGANSREANIAIRFYSEEL